MSPRRVGPLLIRVLPALGVVLWLLFPPVDDGRSSYARQMISEMIGSTAVVLFGIALVLATRARFLEPLFGGLDKMYRSHRDASVAGFGVLVLHVALIPWRLAPGGGVPAGLIAFAGLTVLVVLTLGPRLPVMQRFVTLGYRTWRRTHRLIGLFFVFSLAHMFLVRPLIVTTAIPFAFVMAAYVLGILSYLYGLVLARFVRPILGYVVDEVDRLTETTVEVVLRPRRRALAFASGQFVFVRFKGRVLREPHPFTVASGPEDPWLRLVVKASGDFTRHLYETLEPGHKAKVEGAYGMLDHRRGGTEQIWIAGGIGITPFLSWLRDADILDRQVDFFYTVRNPDEALFTQDIAELAARHHDVAFHLTISARDGSLSMARIESLSRGHLRDKTVYMCGPVGMINAFERSLRDRGVRAEAIHYEEFSFR